MTFRCPYDVTEYGKWKVAVEELVRTYGATYINSRESRPRELWGSYISNDIDFMHFRGQGHRMLQGLSFPMSAWRARNSADHALQHT